MPTCRVCGTTMKLEGEPWRLTYRCTNNQPNGSYGTEFLCYCPVIEAPTRYNKEQDKLEPNWARVKLGAIPVDSDRWKHNPYKAEITKLLTDINLRRLDNETF